MKHALLTVIALSALTLGIAQANAETTEYSESDARSASERVYLRRLAALRAA